jgi:hypothetical protein
MDALNSKFQRELASTKAELESLQQLHKIAVRAAAIGKSATMSSSKPVRPERLEVMNNLVTYSMHDIMGHSTVET